MNTKFQIQIKTWNYDGPSQNIIEEITISDLNQFSDLVKAINNNSGKQIWNWFKNGLPETWNGQHYVFDQYKLDIRMQEYFGYHVTNNNVNIVKEFYRRFTPFGCDGIEWIKFFKVEEITNY